MNPTWRARGVTFADSTRPRVMGILNVTPDSFSDGGQSVALADAIAKAERLVLEGADLIDVGGESSRPGAEVVPDDEEIARVVPAIRALADRLDVPISVDTTKPRVARLALEAGATILNDIRGLDDPDLLALAAETEAGVVLMHMQGTPRTMQDDPRYVDVVAEVLDDLRRKVDRAVRAGIAIERIAVDPGIGFGKTCRPQPGTVEAPRSVRRRFGCVLLVVRSSRKGFLGKGFLKNMTGRSMAERTTSLGGLGSLAGCRGGGPSVVRVHDVGRDGRCDQGLGRSIHGWEHDPDPGSFVQRGGPRGLKRSCGGTALCGPIAVDMAHRLPSSRPRVIWQPLRAVPKNGLAGSGLLRPLR